MLVDANNCQITDVIARVGTGSNRFYTYLSTEAGQILRCEGTVVTNIDTEHCAIRSLHHQRVSGGSISLLYASSLGSIRRKSDI